MKLSKPEYLGGGWFVGLGIIESGFAAYAQCWADEFVPAAYVPVLTIRTQSSNVVMVSFGPIKTCSTIMGGILRFKEASLADDVARRQKELPPQATQK